MRNNLLFPQMENCTAISLPHNCFIDGYGSLAFDERLADKRIVVCYPNVSTCETIEVGYIEE